jgi:hypothetical protein
MTELFVYCSEREQDVSCLHADYPDILVARAKFQKTEYDLLAGRITLTIAIRNLMKELVGSDEDCLIHTARCPYTHGKVPLYTRQGALIHTHTHTPHIINKFKREHDAVQAYLKSLIGTTEKPFDPAVVKNTINPICYEPRYKKKLLSTPGA